MQDGLPLAFTFPRKLRQWMISKCIEITPNCAPKIDLCIEPSHPNPNVLTTAFKNANFCRNWCLPFCLLTRSITGRRTTRTKQRRWRSCLSPKRPWGWRTSPATPLTWSGCQPSTLRGTALWASPEGAALFKQVSAPLWTGLCCHWLCSSLPWSTTGVGHRRRYDIQQQIVYHHCYCWESLPGSGKAHRSNN